MKEVVAQYLGTYGTSDAIKKRNEERAGNAATASLFTSSSRKALE